MFYRTIEMLLAEKEVRIYFGFAFVIICGCLIWEMCLRLGIKRTLNIIGCMVILGGVTDHILKIVEDKHPYDFIYTIHFTEVFYYDDAGSVGERYIIEYDHGMLSCIYRADTRYETRYDKNLNRQEKQRLFDLLQKYQVLKWKEQTGYICRSDFYSLSTDPSSCYLGLPQVEKEFRQKFVCWGDIGEYGFYFHNGFLPDDYNDCMDELWKFLQKVTGAPEWEDEMEENGRRAFEEAYPAIAGGQEGIPDLDRLWYFEYTAIYEGSDLEKRIIRFVLDRSEEFLREPRKTDDLFMSSGDTGDIYCVGEKGSIGLVTNIADRVPPMDFFASKEIDEIESKKIVELLKKYRIVDLGKKEGGELGPQNDIKQCFIYLYDREGNKMRIILDDAHITDEIKGFQTELWDILIREIIRIQEEI